MTRTRMLDAQSGGRDGYDNPRSAERSFRCLPWLIGGLLAISIQRTCKFWLFDEAQSLKPSLILVALWGIVGLYGGFMSRK